MFNSAVLFALVAAVGVSAAPKMNTPTSLVQCQPTNLQWEGQAPFYLTALQATDSATKPVLKTWPETQDTSATWIVDLPAGTNISFQIKDATGELNWAFAVAVQESSDSSCLNSSTTVAGSTGSTGSNASDSSNSTSSAANSTESKTTTTTTDSNGTKTTTQSTTPSGKPDGAAGALRVASGLVGAGVVAALML